MAQKISQLTAKGATIADTDLVEVSQSAGGGAYVSRSVTGANIKALVTDANMTTSDITTNNVSTSKHGFVPKAPNDNTKFLDGTGAWSTPAGGGGGITVGTTAVTSGTVGRIFFQGTGDVVQQDSTLFWDNTNKRLGIGATPSSSVRLDVRAQGALSTDTAFRVRNSADTADILTVAGNRTVWARGGGNQTTNTAFGETAFYTNTTGVENVAIGYGALEFNTTGYRNVAIGKAALNVSTVEGQNTAVGYAALQSNTTAYNNTGIGAVALANNTTGINNTSLGSNALKENTTGSDNIAIGFESGKRITGGSSLTSATSSIFIGSDTRANSNSQSNQIVIGYQAEGLGSNTVVLGNSSIVTTQLRGNVISGNQAALATTATDGFLYIPTCAGTPTGTPTSITGKVPMVADTTNNKLYIYVGGAWTAMN